MHSGLQLHQLMPRISAHQTRKTTVYAQHWAKPTQLQRNLTKRGWAKAKIDGNATSNEFGTITLKALEDVLHGYRKTGYKDFWIEHDSPSKELEELSRRGTK